MERIKVLSFIYSLAVGGTERQFVCTIKALHESGFDMRAGVIWKKGPFLSSIEALPIPIDEYMTPSMYSYKAAIQMRRLSQDIRRCGVDIVHAYGFYANNFAGPAAWLARKPVVIASVRDMGVYLKPIHRRIQRMGFHLVDCIVANSNAVRDWLISEGVNANRIRVIRNGIVIRPEPQKPIEYRVRMQLGIPVDAPVIATVCRVTRSKGLDYLLRSAVHIRKSAPMVRFLIVGKDLAEPGYKTQLEQLAAELELKDCVHFLGERQDVAYILSEADLFVLPSLSEGLSNALLEAMMAGLPIVATNAGGNPEVVINGETGLLVASKNAEELNHAICQILQSPELGRRFGDAGRRRVACEFSVQNMVRQTQDMYLSLLETRHRRVLPFTQIVRGEGE